MCNSGIISGAVGVSCRIGLQYEYIVDVGAFTRPRLGGGVVSRSSPESVKANRTQHNPATRLSLLMLLSRYSAYNQFWSANSGVVSHPSAGNLQV